MLAAPLPDDEAARLDCLLGLELLDTPPDAVLDGLTGCARSISGCPIALVSLVDAERQWFKSRSGLAATETPRAPAFCAHAILGDGLFEIEDARLDPRFADSPLVSGPPHVVYYAGLPLTVDGHRLGTLCVIDHAPRRLTPEQHAGLAALARAVEHWLVSRWEQNAVAAREAVLRKLAAQLPGFVYQFRLFPDGHSAFPFASDRIRELFEVEPESARDDGAPLFARVHPQDLPGLQQSIAVSARQLAPWRQEYRVELPEQGLRWHEAASRPERLADGSVLWHGFVTDITGRKQRDAAYRQVHQRWQVAVDAARLGLIEIDLGAATVRLDGTAGLQHGLDGADTLGLPAWLECFEPADAAALRETIDASHEDGDALALRLRLAGGQRHVELAARCTDGARPGEAHLIGACRDVTGQVELEQLQRDKLAAERSSREKSVFLSRVSHELRTPLNAILGFTQLLQLDAAHPLDGIQRGRVERVHQAGGQLLDLINDVLDLSRLEQGGRPLKPAVVLLEGLLDDACALIEPLALRRGVLIERRWLARPQAVHADARALEQALMNLLSNGVKYNRLGGRLTIALYERGERIEIAVTDQGAGLSAPQIAELFQPFNRLGAETAGIEGSGLGLVISRNLVEAMGGELRVASTPGHGSIFSVLLPRAAEIDAARPAARPATAPPRPSLRPATILYIEDEPVNALLVTETLRAMPHWRVVVAPDGEAGLAQAQRLLPDLLLIDINIPRLNGLEVVQALRREPATRTLPCVALSADALPEQVAAARTAGFDDYWTKPLDLPTLLARLQLQLARPTPEAAALAD